MSWYRMYRPATVADLHLTQVRDSLTKLLARGRVPQVWLFAGPKGTGKTSTARIMAALVNTPANAESVRASFDQRTKQDQQLPALVEPDYTNELVARIKTGHALNVVEMDAASHRGIDDVRLLKERLAVPPAEGLVTVIILDEVHMLTTEAFNALLKLLEEPPQHAMFILATTEQHKLPATVVSRCFVVPFTKASKAELTQALEQIVKIEGVTADEKALQFIADQADGSFRDGVKLAEQLATELGELTADSVKAKLVGNLDIQLRELVAAVVGKDERAVIGLFQAWRAAQTAPGLVEKSLLQLLHTTMLQALGVQPGEPVVNERVAVFLLGELTPVVGQIATPMALLPLEVKCLELVFRAKDKKAGPASSSGVPASGVSSTTISKKTTPAQAAVHSSPISTESLEVAPEPVLEEVEEEIIPEPLVVTKSDNLLNLDPAESVRLLDKWQDFVAGVKEQNSSLAAILGSARPKLGEQGQAQICVFYKFHQEQLQQPRFQKMIEQSLTQVVGRLVPVEYILETSTSSDLNTANPAEALAALAADVLV